MNELNKEIKSWSTQKLREACNELMSWKRTGLLKQDGVMIELRNFVTKTVGEDYQSLSIAEKMVSDEAMFRFVAVTETLKINA